MATSKAPAKKKKKKSPKKLVRAYKGADWYLTEHSQTLCDRFEDDKPAYMTFDISFDNPFHTQWQAAINAAVNYKDDTTVVGEVGEKTGNVELQMQACRDKYNDIMYFAEKAFGKTSPILKQFGKGNKYKDSSNTQGKMLNFMDELSQVANKHKVKLGTVGCTQAIIDTIATVRDGFNTVNRDQNLLRIDRPEISQGRITVYNALYNNFTNLVVKAAKSVYRTDAAKQSQYKYNPPVNRTETTETINITAPPNSTTLAIELEYRADRTFVFTNTSTGFLSIGLNTDGGTGFPTPPALVPGGGTATLVMSDLGPDGTFIMIQNTLMTPGSGTLEYGV